MGLRFRPGRAVDALGMPASELRDRRVALLDLWGDDALRLEERLAAAADAGAPSARRWSRPSRRGCCPPASPTRWSAPPWPS